MRYTIILAFITLALFSCRKEEPKTIKTAGANLPIFPLKAGNVWTFTVTTWNFDSSFAGKTTFIDTIGPTKMLNGEEFWEFGFEHYRLSDLNTVEMIGDPSYVDLETKHIVFAYTDKIDTLWKAVNYSDVNYGDTSICIAYPGDVTVNGLRCRRTDILVYSQAYPGYPSELNGKTTRYFSVGVGPVLQEIYYRTNWYIGQNGDTVQSPGRMHFYKAVEILYTPVYIRYD